MDGDRSARLENIRGAARMHVSCGVDVGGAAEWSLIRSLRGLCWEPSLVISPAADVGGHGSCHAQRMSSWAPHSHRPGDSGANTQGPLGICSRQIHRVIRTLAIRQAGPPYVSASCWGCQTRSPHPCWLEGPGRPPREAAKALPSSCCSGGCCDLVHRA